ncbi:hypothetical protein CBL_07304 [Carabus blaptoides fortunei]
MVDLARGTGADENWSNIIKVGDCERASGDSQPSDESSKYLRYKLDTSAFEASQQSIGTSQCAVVASRNQHPVNILAIDKRRTMMKNIRHTSCHNVDSSNYTIAHSFVKFPAIIKVGTPASSMRVCADLLCHPTPCTIVKGVGVVGPGYKIDWLETQSRTHIHITHYVLVRRNNGKPKWPSNGVIEKPISRTMLLAQPSNGGGSLALAIDSATDILPLMIIRD